MVKNILIVALAITLHLPATAGDIATERTQAATGAITTVLSAITNTIATVTESIEHLENIAGQGLDNFDIDNLPVVGEVFDLLDEVEGIIETGTGIAYTAQGLEDFMREEFETYDTYLGILEADGEIVVERYRERFRDWNDGHRDMLRSVMSAHGMIAEQIDTEEARINTLQDMSTTAEGRLEAMQIGHEIAIEEVKQLQQLRQLIIQQSTMHASFFAVKQAMDAEREATDTFITMEMEQVPIDNGKGY